MRIFIVAVVSTALAWFAFRAADSVTSHDNRDALQAEIARLASRLDALQTSTQVLAVTAARPTLPAPAEVAAPAMVSSPSATETVEPPSAESVGMQLDAALDAQGRDNGWATSTERQIADLMQNEALKGSTLRVAHCQSQLCRAVVAHDDEAAQARFAEELPQAMTMQTQGFMRQALGADNRNETIVYLAREGHLLPLAE